MLSSVAARQWARKSAVVASSTRAFASLEQFEEYGKYVFTGKVADHYLTQQGASGAILKDPTWVNKHSDTVAQAVFDWCVLFLCDIECYHYCCCIYDSVNV
jgi:hypothetical protein